MPPKDSTKVAAWLERMVTHCRSIAVKGGEAAAKVHRGVPKSTEQRKKFSVAKKGLPAPVGAIERLAKANTGWGERGGAEERIENISKARLDQNGTGEYLDPRQCPLYWKWMNDVKSRDNYCCRNCGITEIEFKVAQRLREIKKPQGLHCHHIKSWNEFPDFRYDVSNGLTLCQPCHMIEEGKVRRDKNLFAARQPTPTTTNTSFPIRASNGNN